MLLSIAGGLLAAATLLAATAYVGFTVLWMHAPLLLVLGLAVPTALFPLGLAWLLGRLGKRLRSSTPVIPSSRPARWLLAGATLALLGYGASFASTLVKHHQCSMESSNRAGTGASQVRKDGGEQVCAIALERYDISFGSIERATRKLAFTPVDLTRTPFAQLDALGGTAEYIAGQPSRLYRGFRTGDGHRLTLFEHDMSVDGTRAWRDPKDEPERINGLPARLIVLVDGAGAAVSHLSWFEGRRAYELWVDANVIGTPLRARLFALAASLPPSVPGCPDEVPPKPWQVGPDGFPVDEPMPAVISQAEIDAKTGQRKGRCNGAPP
ncbi:hypothetical protein [Massilia sp. DD77]|uniref:hypothetical protein n=1 Tax=Massilia sp. DD77 TaxID=3109349 RepID=UPI002FFE8E93